MTGPPTPTDPPGSLEPADEPSTDEPLIDEPLIDEALADEALADELLDDLDALILAGIRDGFAELDPPPADLNERSRFAVRTDLDAELSVLLEDESTLATTRDGDPARTLTFESPSATVMITLSAGPDGARLDGWIAPPAPCPLVLRSSDPANPVDPAGILRHAVADRTGRFVFDRLPAGLVQLTVQPAAGGPQTAVATTPFRVGSSGLTADG